MTGCSPLYETQEAKMQETEFCFQNCLSTKTAAAIQEWDENTLVEGGL